ncbi:hypothetical protein Emed_002887 [Eimeria media]
MYTDPQRLECSFDVLGTPMIRLDGAPQTDFFFRLEEEEAPGYVICICVGPHTRALPEYRGCMPKALAKAAALSRTTAPTVEAWRFKGCCFPDLVAAAKQAASSAGS